MDVVDDIRVNYEISHTRFTFPNRLPLRAPLFPPHMSVTIVDVRIFCGSTFTPIHFIRLYVDMISRFQVCMCLSDGFVAEHFFSAVCILFEADILLLIHAEII